MRGELGGSWLSAARANSSFKKHKCNEIFPYKCFSVPLRSTLILSQAESCSLLEFARPPFISVHYQVRE